MSAAERLYTPDLLAAAVELADYPPIEAPTASGIARSPTCGSTVELSLALGSAGQIERLGLRVHACAVGQGAAAVFARHCIGKTLTEIETAQEAFARWLAGDAPLPDWPDLELIAPARATPARHGAMLLPWKAAIAALSSAPASS